MRTLGRHKYLTPDETARLLDLLDCEALVAIAHGHRIPARDALLVRLEIVCGPRTSEANVAPGVLVHRGVNVVGFRYWRDFASVAGLSMGIILL